ncbi:MAG TPA: hypothetical protein VFC54_11260 [Pseudolabrys sp.]|nr:hypothetical protein [Pseudolabrys sp.]
MHPQIMRASAIAALGLALSACAGSPGTQEHTMESFLVPPDQYSIYNCAQLAQTTVAKQTRARELEALIAKAGTGAGGSFASAVAYRPEYYQVRGELNELRRREAEKNCKPVPGAATAAGSLESPALGAGANPGVRQEIRPIH